MWIIGIIEKNLSKTCLTTREWKTCLTTDLQIFTNINIDVTINWIKSTIIVSWTSLKPSSWTPTTRFLRQKNRLWLCYILKTIIIITVVHVCDIGLGCQSNAPGWQPIASRPSRDFRVRETVIIRTIRYKYMILYVGKDTYYIHIEHTYSTQSIVIQQIN